jgi:hypothetical protein
MRTRKRAAQLRISTTQYLLRHLAMLRVGHIEGSSFDDTDPVFCLAEHIMLCGRTNKMINPSFSETASIRASPSWEKTPWEDCLSSGGEGVWQTRGRLRGCSGAPPFPLRNRTGSLRNKTGHSHFVQLDPRVTWLGSKTSKGSVSVNYASVNPGSMAKFQPRIRKTRV